MPTVAAALASTAARIVGVSPIVGGRVVRGMAHRLLPAVGANVDAAGVATWYGARMAGGLLDAWIVDTVDAHALPAVRELGMMATATDTLMDDPDIAAALARTVLGLGHAWPQDDRPGGPA